jgi:hypothetical protein
MPWGYWTKSLFSLVFCENGKKYLVPGTLNCLVNSKVVGRALMNFLLACSSSPSMKSLVSCPAVALLNSTSSGLGTVKNENSIFWLKL